MCDTARGKHNNLRKISRVDPGNFCGLMNVKICEVPYLIFLHWFEMMKDHDIRPQEMPFVRSLWL
jgi:hypothetical protein